MAEVKYYEAIVNVSGTTKLGVYARSNEEAEKLLNEHLYYLGVDKFSSDLDLDVCEVVSIEKSDKQYAYDLVNDKDDLWRETMAEYSYKDVIIDPNDPRVEIGTDYYFALGAQACIDYANMDVRISTLDDIDTSGNYNPFITSEKDYPFIIRKKEPEKKYMPFDLRVEK